MYMTKEETNDMIDAQISYLDLKVSTEIKLLRKDIHSIDRRIKSMSWIAGLCMATVLTVTGLLYSSTNSKIEAYRNETQTQIQAYREESTAKYKSIRDELKLYFHEKINELDEKIDESNIDLRDYLDQKIDELYDKLKQE